jgi:GNAT superfamily N-acetyltransferase
MLQVRNQIRILAVDATKRKRAQAFILRECMHHYQDRIAPSRYDVLRLRLEAAFFEKGSAFFIALNESDEVVGSIGVSRYDNRIQSLEGHFDEELVAEVGRCYVDEAYRRQGIASRLFDEALAYAKEEGYETLYLHTHYFLPGGFFFWKSQGFEIVHDEGGVWQTVHMEKSVEERACCTA